MGESHHTHGQYMDDFFPAAAEQARTNFQAGAVPIGSVLVCDGKIIGRGRNRRHAGNAILHAEIDCLQDAGRLTADVYRRSTLYSTLSPCPMCSGATLLFKIPRVEVGENVTFQGPQKLLEQNGVAVNVRQDRECIEMMVAFMEANVELWAEDIAVSPNDVLAEIARIKAHLTGGD